MIHELLKTQRKTTSAVVYPMTSSYVNNQLSHAEYLRRNNILITLVKDCGYNPGNIVRPSTKEAFDKEGYFRVTGIANNWLAYKGSEKDESKVEWPKNDNPKIVTIKSLKDGQVYECTTNYVVAVTDHKEIADAQTLGC